MLDITKDVQSLTAFRRRPSELMKQLKKTKRPIVLTVNGKAEAVLQNAGSYQRLLDMAARADAVEGICQGLEDLRKGRFTPAREGLETFRRKHDVPRCID